MEEKQNNNKNSPKRQACQKTEKVRNNKTTNKLKRRKVSEREMDGKEKHQTKTVDEKGNERTSKPREDSTLNPPPSSNSNTLTLHAALPCFFYAATAGFGENGLPSAHRGFLSLVGIFVGLFPVTQYTFILLCYHCWHTCWIFSCHMIQLYLIMLLMMHLCWICSLSHDTPLSYYH